MYYILLNLQKKSFQAEYDIYHVIVAKCCQLYIQFNIFYLMYELSHEKIAV